jgi:hypothetical protein
VSILVETHLLSLRQNLRPIPGPHHRRAPADAAIHQDYVRCLLRISVGGADEILRFDGRIGEADRDEANLPIRRRLTVRIARYDLLPLAPMCGAMCLGRLIAAAAV